MGVDCTPSRSKPESTESGLHLGRGTSERGVVSCARSVTHRRVRALACSSPPSAHLAPHPNLLRPIGGSGLKGKFQSYTWLAVIAWVVVIADRVTKIVVEHRYGVGYGPRPLIDHVLFLTVLRNSGAAFALFQNFTPGFLAVSLLGMAAILVYYPRIPAYHWPARTRQALAL